MQDEIIQIQIKYQKELEKLERDNKELRKQNLLMKGGRKQPLKKIKVYQFWMFAPLNLIFWKQKPYNQNMKIILWLRVEHT